MSSRNLSNHIASLALTAITLAAAGTAVGKPDQQREFQDVMHDVLAHGNLADFKFLSARLGLDLEMPASEVAREPDGYRTAIVRKNPDLFFATRLSYSARHSQGAKTSIVNLRFKPRICPNLAQWANAWGKAVKQEMFTHAAGASESLSWSAPGGIDIAIAYFTAGRCEVTLTQEIADPVAFDVTPDLSPDPGNLLGRSVAEILAAGDLRNYKTTAAALHAELQAESTQNDLLYKGNAELLQIIPTVNNSQFSYYADDTGWRSRPAYFATPRQIADRIVGLWVNPDVRQVCLRLAEIIAALKRRAVTYRMTKQTPDQVDISSTGDNLISLNVFTRAGCTAALTFTQITNIANNIGNTVFFLVDMSLDASSGSLSLAALAQVDFIVRHVPTAEIRLASLHVNVPESTFRPQTDPQFVVQQEKAKKLAEIIRQAFVSRGVDAISIAPVVPYAFDSMLSAGRARRDEDGVYFDAVSEK